MNVGETLRDFQQGWLREKARADELEKEIKRLKRLLIDAPHGTLCKKGFENLFDPGGKCTCWKRDIEK